MTALGHPRLHLRSTDSTNERARSLARSGAPHGTLVTAAHQHAGRGRQGRTWSAPPGRALLMSVLLRNPPPLVSLTAGLAVADAVGAAAKIKWPNDVLLGDRKVAGILVEARAGEDWAVVGIGINVAVRLEDLPEELHDRAGTLGLGPDAVEATLAAVLDALARRLAQDDLSLLADLRSRDALLGRPVRWARSSGIGAGIDEEGRLLVTAADGTIAALDAGEVHLERP